ncbi:hypothetical protein [Bacillus safensis]|uniref:hypothetical protein n=1 Tax=Bacillus safensis TaxID=561879 RepID=UPI001CD26A80|nr:hypothetical protein [Bacillus safensis]
MSLLKRIQHVVDGAETKVQGLITNNNYSPKEGDKIVEKAALKIQGINANDTVKVNIGVISPIIINIPVPDPKNIIPNPPIPTPEELEQQAKRQAQKLTDAVKAKLVETAQNAINELRNQIPDPTEQARQMIAEIESYKEQLNSLLEQLNPVALLNKALDKAEQISEEYIDSKMVQVFEPLHLKGKSDVECSLDGNKINGSVSLYLVLEDFDGDFTQKFLKSLSITGEVDLSNLNDIDISDPVLHDGNIDIQEEIKSRIEKQQEEIISGLTEAVIDSYLPIFTVINNFKEMMKI